MLVDLGGADLRDLLTPPRPMAEVTSQSADILRYNQMPWPVREPLGSATR